MVTCASNDYNNNYKIIQLIRGENDGGICSFGVGAPPYCDPFEDEDCESIYYRSCEYNGLSCSTSSENYISCSDTSTNASCSINSNGEASCN